MKNNINFLLPYIKEYKKYKDGGKFNKIQSEECAEADNDYGKLFLKFLWIRDQAHIFHWQTKSNSQHTAFGGFYEEYLDELDELAESMFGQTEETFTIGKGSIKLMDYSEENIKSYLTKVTDIFIKEFPLYFEDNHTNIGLYHIVGDILEVISKLKYLLSQD